MTDWNFDPYKVLGLNPRLLYSTQQVTHAFRAKSKQLHPDKNLGFDTKRLFQQIQKSHEILSNESLAKVFNNHRYRGLEGAWMAAMAALGNSHTEGQVPPKGFPTEPEVVIIDSGSDTEDEPMKATNQAEGNKKSAEKEFDAQQERAAKKKAAEAQQEAAARHKAAEAQQEAAARHKAAEAQQEAAARHKAAEAQREADSKRMNEEAKAKKAHEYSTTINELNQINNDLQKELECFKSVNLDLLAKLKVSEQQVSELRKENMELIKKTEVLKNSKASASQDQLKEHEKAQEFLTKARTDADKARHDRKDARKEMQLAKKLMIEAKTARKMARRELEEAKRIKEKAKFSRKEDNNSACQGKCSVHKSDTPKSEKRRLPSPRPSDSEPKDDVQSEAGESVYFRGGNMVPRFPCTKCGKTFATTRYLTRHQKSHFRPPVECNICKNKYTRADVLKTHMAIKHSKPSDDK